MTHLEMASGIARSRQQPVYRRSDAEAPASAATSASCNYRFGRRVPDDRDVLVQLKPLRHVKLVESSREQYNVFQMKRVIIVAAIVAGLCVAAALAHLALIEVGREVVVVHEPTPTGGVRKARLWIVDEGRHSWIHPGSANAQWWVRHMDANPIVEVERGGQTRRYRATPDPEAHAKVHKLLREKYGVADRWVRFLAGTDTQSGFLTGQPCTTVPIRLEPFVAAPYAIDS
jgi:hypothetical protein